MFVQDAVIWLDRFAIDDMEGTVLDFCYLVDMLCASGGCKLAIITRCGIAWVKFKRLLPVLTSKHCVPQDL